MRTDFRRPALVMLALVSVLSIGALVSWAFESGGRQSARFAAEDLATNRRLAGEIRQLRLTAQSSPEGGKPGLELAARVESAALAAAVRSDQILQIDPQEPVAVGNTRYENTRTRIDLRGVTLEQVVRTLHATLTAEPSLSVERLNLRPPAHSADDRTWDADVVVSRVTLRQDGPSARRP